jgi:hypothetical protein
MTMNNEYTKMGYKLEYMKGPNALLFRCMTRYVAWSKEGFLRGNDYPVALLQLIAPCDQAQVIHTLRSWLGAYDDQELLEQVQPVVEAAISEMPPVPAADPAASSQTKDLN